MNLKDIRQKIIEDNSWATKKGWEPIYTAHPDAQIAIIGQAPGKRTQKKGIPWDDPSGDNLRIWLGLSKDEFYSKKVALIPMDFYFPGSGERGDKPPRKYFAAKWHPLILNNMPNIKLIILIGQYAQKHYLGSRMKMSLTDTVRSYTEYIPEYIPLVHPSPRNNIWHKKNPWFKDKVISTLQKEVSKQLK